MTDSPDDHRTMPVREIAVREKEPRLGLSASQIVATALAAVTATFAASYLGVAGTLIGAAVSSIVSVVGGSIYTRSLDRTHESLRRVPARRTGTTFTAVEPAAESGAARPAESGAARPAARVSAGPPTTQRTQVVDLPTGPGVSDPRTGRERLPWRPLVLASAGIFVIVIAAVVGFELVTGQPISATVRGESGSGTTFTPERGDSATTVPDPAQSATPTPTGAESGAQSTSPSPSSSSGPSTSPSPSESPSSTATPSPEPSGSTPSPSTSAD